jgi:hypothetical protein
LLVSQLLLQVLILLFKFFLSGLNLLISWTLLSFISAFSFKLADVCF